jgi:hypothetical protein
LGTSADIKLLAERVGFEPTDAFTSPVFKTGAFDHSAISPYAKAPLLPDASNILPCGAGFVNKKNCNFFAKNLKLGVEKGKELWYYQ